MGDQFSDGEKQWRREQRRKEQVGRIVLKRTSALVRFLQGGKTFESFLTEYMEAGPDFDLPFGLNGKKLPGICIQLQNGSRLEWASLLFRMRRHHGCYVKLRKISPFADKILVSMGLTLSTSGSSVTVSGEHADVLKAHALMESGRARFRSIDGTGYYVVTKAKYAPAKDGRDFRDG